MFRAATAAKPVLSRRASLVESSEQVKVETRVLTELSKGLYSIHEAMIAKDDSDRSAARFNAIAAYENTLRLLESVTLPNYKAQHSRKNEAPGISHWKLPRSWIGRKQPHVHSSGFGTYHLIYAPETG